MEFIALERGITLSAAIGQAILTQRFIVLEERLGNSILVSRPDGMARIISR